MRRGLIGFAVGSLALIALWAAVQARGVRGLQEGGDWLISGLRRLTSPDVAGVPQIGVATDALIVRRRDG